MQNLKENEFFAIKVEQPYGTFYQVSLSAKLLLKVCFVNQATENDNLLTGIQRKESAPRAREIAAFIDSEEAAFPNAIILSVNYDVNDRLIDEDYQWKFIEIDPEHTAKNLFKLVIPDTTKKACSVIDGQHRLLGFEYANRTDISLACSIYEALPPSGQASLFSTINFNQRKVDKSLAYQLFGYSLDKTDRDNWSPDMLAVYFSRKFNTEEGNPFYNKIKYRVIGEDRSELWSISSSAFIDGVLSLLSKTPKNDRYIINNSFLAGSLSRKRLNTLNDNSPLRSFFIEGNDLAIEQILKRFFSKVNEIFWTDVLVSKNIVLVKTVGISALFDILKTILQKNNKIDKQIFAEFDRILDSVKPEELLDEKEYPATTKGRTLIYKKFISNA